MLTNGYTLNTFANWKRILQASPQIEPKYIPKLIYLASTGMLTAPLQRLENKRFSKTIRKTQIHETPIFIMGFWRTGTTHLHNLLVQDSNYGYLSTLHSMMPGLIVNNGKILRPLIQTIFPKIRPMDNIALTLDAPQEEDIALMNISPHTFYHYILFPKKMRFLFEKYGLMHKISPNELEEWRENYLYILRTATYLSDGKPLILKSPSHTAHTPQILGLFPKARFIEMRRNPLSVWLSFLHLHRSIIPAHHLQDFSWKTLEEDALHIFEKTMKKWLKDRDTISEKNITVVYYEDLISSPLKILNRIYEKFGLSSKGAKPYWEAYLKSIKGYRNNHLAPKPDDFQTVKKHLAFLYEAWGYPLPKSQIPQSARHTTQRGKGFQNRF